MAEAQSSKGAVGVTATLQGPLPGRFHGKTLTNIYNTADKLSVSTGGVALFTPDSQGAPQVFFLGQVANPTTFRKPNAYKAQTIAAWAIFVGFLVVYALLPLAMLAARTCLPSRRRRNNRQQPCSKCPPDAAYLWCSKPDSSPTNSATTIASSIVPTTTMHVRISAPPSEPVSTLLTPAASLSRGLSHLSIGTALSRGGMGMIPAGFTGGSAGAGNGCADSSSDDSDSSASTLELPRHNTQSSDLDVAAAAATVDATAATAPRVASNSPAQQQHRMKASATSGSGSGNLRSILHPPSTPRPSPAASTATMAHAASSAGLSCASSSSAALARGLLAAPSAGSTEVAAALGGSSIELSALGGNSSTADLTVLGDMDNTYTNCLFDASDSSSSSSSGSLSDDAGSSGGGGQHVERSGAGGSMLHRLPTAFSVESEINPAALAAPSPFSCSPPAVALPAPAVPAPTSATVLTCSTPTMLHVSLEWSMPQVLALNNLLMFGGMGMVVDTFVQHWQGPLALCAPLYKPCYAADSAGGYGPSDRPFFIPAHQAPLLALTVDVARGWQLPVEVFKVEMVVGAASGPAAGQPRTYYLVQSDLFRHRDRAGMYSFECEAEMMTLLAVFNKAVASVVMAEGFKHMHLHDYHGALSLMYMPKELRPAVVLTCHNAHYNGRFPIPTPARKHQVYELLNLTPDAAKHVEHNGCVDILRPAVVHIRSRQQGKGVVAVSPRYAAQVSMKLSCFWALPPVGRPSIRGILNSLDMRDSLAAAGLPLGQVLSIKAAAKEQLQRQYGLAVGQEYSLATFVGRMTHQKGVDIIAHAAAGIMQRHPTLQLVVLGPAGDPVGRAASEQLWRLSAAHPGRMHCPMDHYVSGHEKELLIQATDFCLLPSRFEPCGLVDVEFGWNGAIIIGHDTGGLGKMPGVYFTAQAGHLEHLSRKLGLAVDNTMSLPPTARHERMQAALARRFPVPGMMQQYADAWGEVDRAAREVQASQQSAHAHGVLHSSFFATHWSRSNQPHGQQQQTQIQTQQQLAVSSSCAQTSPFASPAQAAGAIVLNRADPAGSQGADTRHNSHDSSSSTAIRISTDSNQPEGHCSCTAGCFSPSSCSCCPSTSCTSLVSGGSTDTAASGSCSSRSTSASVQALSNCLMVVLQPLALGPGVLLLSFLLLIAAPLWFWLATILRPASYIRMAAATVSLSFAVAFLALQLTQLLTIAVVLTAVTNLVACPLLSLGLLGEEGVDVCKVGRSMLALSEFTRYALLAACLGLAAAALGPLPHLVLGGLLLLGSGGIALWLWSPGALTDAYQHLSLSLKGQSRFLLHLSCFWLSLLAGACDSLAMLLTGFVVINLTRSLGFLALFQAVAFAGSALAVVWNWRGLCSRVAEVHLNAAVLLLAAMLLYQAIKAGVLMAQLPAGVTLGVCAAIDVLMGGRSSVLGLAGFVTLPSREIVAVWQFAGILLGSVGGIAVLGGAYAGVQFGVPVSSWVLFGVVAGLEVLRAAAMGLFARVYGNENLSAP